MAKSYIFPIPPCPTIHLQSSLTRTVLNQQQSRGRLFMQISRCRSLTVDDSLMAVPSPMAVQHQIPQYLPTTTTAPMTIPAASRSPYLQQPLYGAQSLPMYAQQPQQARYSMSGYTYGTPATTQYVPGSAGGSYIFVQDRSPSPHRHHHHHSFGHRHRCGHRHRHGHRCFSHRRHSAYSDPEYDHRYRRY